MGFISRIRSQYSQITYYQKFFLLCVLLESVAVIIIQSVGLTSYDAEKEKISHKLLSYYSILFFIAIGFSLIFSVVIVVSQNLYQLFTFAIVILVYTIYAIYEIITLHHNPRIIVLFIIIIIFDIIYGVIFYFLYRDFSFSFFNIAGGTPIMHELYRVWSIFTTLIQLDFMVSVLLLIAGAFFLLRGNDPELWFDVIFVVSNLFYLWFSYISVKIEKAKQAKICISLSFIQPIYLIVKMILILVQKEKYKDIPRVPVIMMLLMGLIIRIVLLIFFFKAVKNFDQGLKGRLSNNVSTDMISTLVDEDNDTTSSSDQDKKVTKYDAGKESNQESDVDLEQSDEKKSQSSYSEDKSSQSEESSSDDGY
ncbi:hypothetical protein M0812_23596 [Anaeramoeba flamelloides]|uniref:DUF7789 domain-containing protein n=1 Tax=Anaeramoeba flamelloides TaxID=1746091 RepID=A0AAV7YRK9_9EUKA|nr:hypothetical protein M0812_23596 [Anaeramoeba flamelloides]